MSDSEHIRGDRERSPQLTAAAGPKHKNKASPGRDRASSAGRVLVVDDEADARNLLEIGLVERGFEVITAESAEAALELLDDSLDVVLTDVKLGAMDGISLCREIAERDESLPVIVITAFGQMDMAIAAIRASADDFVSKPFKLGQIELVLKRAVRDRNLHRQVKRLSAVLAEASRERALVGNSAQMRAVYELITQVAQTSATALIMGDTGTGKELVARAIHDQSGRTGEFVAINCAAIPASLLESELFGHVKGAFTDARNTRRGLFCQADGGTLFLDEIGEMALETQVKLLRVLQERKVRPLGGDTEQEFDAHIIAATNRDQSSAVAAGEFREDLYYRINIVPITLPPLRERGDDVLLLAQSFLERAAKRSGKNVTGISVPVAAKLMAYNWPGNVRELENTIERAVAFTGYTELMAEDLPERIRDQGSGESVFPWPADGEELPTLAEVESRYVRRVLAAVHGNKTRAAQLLGIDRRTLYRYLRRLDIKGVETKKDAHADV